MNTITPRTATVTLYQGDDVARLAELEQRAAKGRKQSGGARTADEVPAWQEAAEEYDALTVEAKERAVKVTLRALGRKEWRDLVNAHPPREGHKGDEAVGLNESSFADDLVPASILEPTFSSDAEKAYFLDSLSDIQFEELYLNAFALNRSRSADPKDGLLSALTAISDGTSN